MVDGRIAVHEACKEGFIGVLKALLEFNPDLEMLVRLTVTVQAVAKYTVITSYLTCVHSGQPGDETSPRLCL